MNAPIRAIVFDPDQRHWLNFSSPVRVYSTRELPEVLHILKEVEHSCASEKLWAVGWISYEAAPAFDEALQVGASTSFPKVWFATFTEPTVTSELPPTDEPPFLSWNPSVSSEEYHNAVRSIRGAIARGDTYQVNYSFRLTSTHAPAPLPLFSAMVRSQGGDYSALIETGDYSIASASPELFFSKDGTSLVSRPMKGTAPRGLTYEQDAIQAQELRTSQKNRAENIMIVDMTRNDLSRIAERGSVAVSASCAIERYPHMLQMTSEVVATSQSSVVEILQALFPAASITGAPKPETMRIIAQHENSPRNIYTGTLGVITPHNRAWFNVAIRTALIDHIQQTTEYGIGSGIVWDSSSDMEYEECLAKASAVTRATPPSELFETILWEPRSGFFLLEEHLSRLSESAEYLSCPFTIAHAVNELDTLNAQLSEKTQPQRVKLFLSRRGTTRVEVTPLNTLPSPYIVSLARDPISSRDITLYRKTTDRRVYDCALPVSSHAHDVILWNELGEITETRIANICLEIDGVLYTPPVSSGLLNGCYRQHLVAQGAIIERRLAVADLSKASRIILINSLRRSWEAHLCEGRRSVEATAS